MLSNLILCSRCSTDVPVFLFFLGQVTLHTLYLRTRRKGPPCGPSHWSFQNSYLLGSTVLSQFVPMITEIKDRAIRLSGLLSTGSLMARRFPSCWGNQFQLSSAECVSFRVPSCCASGHRGSSSPSGPHLQPGYSSSWAVYCQGLSAIIFVFLLFFFRN